MKEGIETKRKTRLFNLVFVGLGMVLVVFGILTWQSFDSVSKTFLSSLERQGYVIPASVSTRFRQITVLYVLITWIGIVLCFVGAINELDSFFELK